MKFNILALAAAVAASPLQRRYGDLIRGVNIGGLFVLEPWITPSVFDQTGNPAIVDEWTFGQYQDHAQAESAINSHLETFFTYDDFQQIKNAGLTHVRIPVGFWAIETQGEPYIVGNRLNKLKEVVRWCRDIGLKVWIDLHGAPGSQNGLDNSGLRTNNVQWHTDQNNVDRSLSYIQTLTDEFTKPEYGAIVEAIELLNEPQSAAHPEMLGTLKSFYQNGYGIVSQKAATAIHDGFLDVNQWNDFLTSPQENVYLDTHKYQVFSDQQLQSSDEQRMGAICQFKDKFAEHTANQHWVITGEWSLATTDCARYLNGRGIGARYDGSYSGSSYVGSCQGKTGDGSDWSEEYRNQLRQMWNTQVDAFEGGRGYFFWTWKNEEAADWSYQRLLQLGIIPQDPNSYQHGICG
ncbi:cellulase [Wallemia mellicola]|uniref:Cellulase n=1 Tax=Wallemia mellicola TaxID=1708541 RepID=A0A4T0THX9_9BASI|nr:hypothetical protein E3Q23_02592 [Wallemia mellicola]TIB91272.1 cellulase [Wallemia mellicola]TIB97056.1 cellulase [Wallemia mellicola]TIC10626.1 cellulase [Wallemia mellicola]TIC27155.1 cellulase [Wallemia mellicola]